jgi:XTP/dITP diphosphohydrolase
VLSWPVSVFISAFWIQDSGFWILLFFVNLLLATRNRNKVIEMQHALEGIGRQAENGDCTATNRMSCSEGLSPFSRPTCVSTGWQVKMLTEIPGAPEVEEDGTTFQENALKKARSAARYRENGDCTAPAGAGDSSATRSNASLRGRVPSQGLSPFSPCWVLAEDSGLEVDALGGEPGVRSARYAGEGATAADLIRKVLGRMVSVRDDQRTARFRCVMCVIDPEGRETCFEGRCEGRIAQSARGSSGFGYDPIFIPDGYDQTFAELGLAVKGKISHRARAMQQVITFLRQTDSEVRR